MDNTPQLEAKPRLIINADDFGLTDSVNKAIIDIFKAGNLTSATLMVNMPGTESAADLAKQNPALGVGLHFCITEGEPLTEAETLKSEEGSFISRSELVKRISMGKVSKADIAVEFEAQLQRMIQLGVTPTHADSHQHTMMIPFVFDAIHPVLKKHDLNIRVVNPPVNFMRLLFSRPKKFVKQALNSYLAKRIFKKYPDKSNHLLVSIHELDVATSTLSEDSYRQLLQTRGASNVVELMVHPYLDDDTFKEMYAQDYSSKRVFIEKCIREHSILSKRPLFDAYELCSFREING